MRYYRRQLFQIAIVQQFHDKTHDSENSFWVIYEANCQPSASPKEFNQRPWLGCQPLVHSLLLRMRILGNIFETAHVLLLMKILISSFYYSKGLELSIFNNIDRQELMK